MQDKSGEAAGQVQDAAVKVKEATVRQWNGDGEEEARQAAEEAAKKKSKKGPFGIFGRG